MLPNIRVVKLDACLLSGAVEHTCTPFPVPPPSGSPTCSCTVPQTARACTRSGFEQGKVDGLERAGPS